MAGEQLKSLSIRHEAIMDYLMANPKVRLGDVAREFGVTQGWLSQIIHSDAFQNLLKEKQGIAFHNTVLPLREKMLAVAHQAMDKIADELPDTKDLRTIHDVAEGMLDRLGFSSKPLVPPGNLTINQQNNFVTPNANAAEIAAARQLLEKARNSALGVTIDGVSTPIALPGEGAPAMGQAMPSPHIPFTPGEYSSGEGGLTVREEGSRETV